MSDAVEHVEAEVVAERDARGHFRPGNTIGQNGGRPRGSVDRWGPDFQNDLRDSYKQLGGIAYLVQLGINEPKAYVTLLNRVLGPELQVMVLAQQTEADRTVLEIRDYAGVGPDADELNDEAQEAIDAAADSE